MQCCSCGYAISRSAKFCRGCGTNLVSPLEVDDSEARQLTINQGRVGQRNSYNVTYSKPQHGSASPNRVDDLAIKLERSLKPALTLYSLLMLSSFVAGVVSGFADVPVIASVSVTAFDMICVVLFSLLYPLELPDLLSIKRLSLRRLIEVALFAVIFFVLFESAFTLLEWLTVPFIKMSQLYIEAGLNVWTILILLSVLPAFLEELAFRGVIQSGLERVLTRAEACIIQAALFSVIHLSPIIFPTHFAMGLAFGWIRIRTRSLYPSILMHMLWNAWAVLGETPGPIQ